MSERYVRNRKWEHAAGFDYWESRRFYAERDLQVWLVRYSEGSTYEKIGQRFRLSRERIRQIVAKTEKRLLEMEDPPK